MSTNRSSFTGKIGFVLAAAGSAVGLGNIWRFPYLAAKYGGGFFLLVYIALSITFGFSLMVAEIAIGRKTQQSPLGAFRSLNKRFSFLGVLASIVPIIIFPYYSVIGGWVVKWFAGFVSGQTAEMAADGFFGNYIGKTGEPILWFGIFIAIAAIIVLCGVEKGIEKVSKVMMPLLVVLMLFIVIYTTVTVDGAWEGVLYYITPDFSDFSFNKLVMTVLAAMGQLFYSMSLAMGIMVTYGSYMKKDVSIESAVHQVEWFDTGVAFLAGLMIVPATFAFSGGDPAALGAGPKLMFVTLPKVFDTMPGGSVIGALFFAMVFLAALTSAISLMETIVATFLDKVKIGRKACSMLVLAGGFLLGLPSSLGYSAWSSVIILSMPFLDFFDFISNNLLMPVVALVTSILVGFIIKPQTVIEEVELSGKFKWKKMFTVMIRYIAPIFLVLILVSSVLNAFGVIKI